MADSTNIDKTIQLEVGSKLYHWRYGEMIVRDMKDEYIILEIHNFSYIKYDEKLLDPWENHLKENPKIFLKTDLDKWLFKVPERVGSSKPAYGNKDFISDEIFLRKLNTIFNEEQVMECKNNYSLYIKKKKFENLNKDQGYTKENDLEINMKEINELARQKDEYTTRKREKEEEVAYISSKLLDYDLQLSTLEENIGKCKRKISDKEKRIVVKENELDKLDNDANTSVYNKNQGLILDIEDEIRRLEDVIDESRDEINEAGRSIEKISKEQDKLHNRRSILNKEIGSLTNKIEKMESTLGVLK